MSATAAPVETGIETEGHFNSVAQQRETAELGMWVFLMTELLLFSTLFVSALILRVLHPAAVTLAAMHLKMAIGAINTAVLLLSSLTMTAAIELSRLGRKRWMIQALHATAAFGGLFIVLKGYEYYDDYDEHMMPFFHWRPFDTADNPASQLFIDLYYIITSLHAVHLTIGIGAVLITARMAHANDYLKRHANRIPILGLYWHFIDVVWIIVYPTLYVLNR